jgi:anthranilate phosphoribosyltransferase
MNIANFSSQEFEEFFSQIINDKINDDSVKRFLLNLNKENLPTNAFIGAITALKKEMKLTVKAPEGAIDVCGTGGDKLGTLNVSTAVCFVVAACGVTVAKHGNKAISSKSGSADIFAALGVGISSDASEIENNLRDKKLCFLFAPFFHQALKNVAGVRKSLGVPTIFNFLGPLLNPANTKIQLIGTSRRDTMLKLAGALKNSAKSTYIVHGFDGMDEITLTDNSYLIRLENGKIFEEEIINPEEFGFKKVGIEELKGGDPKYNAQKLLELLDGEKSAYRDIVLLNAAFALRLAGKVENIDEGVEMARSAIDSGEARKVLNSLINCK